MDGQPESRYVRLIVPAETLVTNPVLGSMDATPGPLLLHVPPGLALLIEAVNPKQIEDGPVTGATGLMVTTSIELSLTHPNAEVWVT